MIRDQSLNKPFSTIPRAARIRFAVEVAVFCLPLDTRAERALPLPANDAFIELIAERIRGVVSRQSLESLDAVANTLLVGPAEFRALINDRKKLIDEPFLVDVVAAFVYEFAVDPEWLLTGHYNGSTHREALLIVEDRTVTRTHVIRQFVQERYERLRGPGTSVPPASSKSST